MPGVSRTLAWAYRLQLIGLRDNAANAIARLLTIDIDHGTRVEAAAAAVATAQSLAATTADRFLADIYVVAQGDPRPPLGLNPEQYRNPGKLRDAYATILTRPREEWFTAARLVAQTEPMWSARTALRDAMTEQGTPGWTRLADADPCPLCRSLADGTVLPAHADMKQHPGCSCVQQPLLR